MTNQTDWPIQIIRSERRSRTVSARLEKGVMVVRVPASISDLELAPILENLKERIERKIRPIDQSDEQLLARANWLNQRYFDGKLRWQSIRYVKNQTTLYGSCTPANATIRISDRVASMPEWVRDYIIVHELAHLIEANHGARFWQLVNRYPMTERARGYLIALALESEEGESS